ncbi:MAG: 1-deoxy-D-xylulose-5-phosphate synthase, partial [Spirochaetales bacterium]
VTKKGKGHSKAEEDPASWHGVAPTPAVAACDSPDSAESPPDSRTLQPSFTQAFGAAMLCAAENDSRIVAVTAAMAKGTGLTAFQSTFPARLFDVGIAEEHAVTFAAGMAAGGLKPVVAIYSTFMQRAVDQVIHDVALGRLPVVFALDRAGAVPDDGETHQGIYDIQIFRGVPGLSILAPASAAELSLTLQWALGYDGPSMIRYPKALCPPERPAYLQPLEYGRGVFVRRGEGGADIVLIGSGALTEECVAAAGLLERQGLDADVYNLRFLKPVDTQIFLSVVRDYRYALIAEEGILEGSVAVDLATLAGSNGVRSLALGFRDVPKSQAGRAELLRHAGLSAERLAGSAMDLVRGAGVGKDVSA